MASPALNTLHGGGSQPPPAYNPSTAKMPPNGHIPRPSSETRSTAPEVRSSQPPMPSPSLPQGENSSRYSTPTNNTHRQTSTGGSQRADGTDEYRQLASLVQTAKADIVRQVVRDQWQRCLTGSDFHVGFILNTTLHHASPSLLDQAVKDFGGQLVPATKHTWVQHLAAKDLDEIADALFQRASDHFLDRALARRFETISGRALVNALARAERLGYDIRDIVEERDTNQPEQVIPSVHPPVIAGYRSNGQSAAQYSQQAHPQQPQKPSPQPAPAPFFVLRHSAEQIASAKPLGITFCDPCGRPCSGLSALEYHAKKRACANHVTKLDRFGSDTCMHCGVNFGSAGGLVYHNNSAVCGAYTPTVCQQMMSLLAHRARTPIPKPAPQSSPNPGYHTPTQAVATRAPVRHEIADQYAGLSPQQQSQFDNEMKSAEEFYGQQMRDAMTLPQAQADIELGKIKNRLNSRQSNLRKKYGIKLRERRTREQIEHDNARIAQQAGTGTPQIGTPPQSQRTNTTGVKRPSSAYDDSPRKRVPLSEMSGLSGAAASAEMTDPTLNNTPSAPSSSLPSRLPQTVAPAEPPSSLPPRPLGITSLSRTESASNAARSMMGSGNAPDGPMDIDSGVSEDSAVAPSEPAAAEGSSAATSLPVPSDEARVNGHVAAGDTVPSMA